MGLIEKSLFFAVFVSFVVLIYNIFNPKKKELPVIKDKWFGKSAQGIFKQQKKFLSKQYPMTIRRTSLV